MKKLPTPNYYIHGSERRSCCVDGCRWRDLDRGSGDYGAYVADGYVCKEHAKLYDSRGKRLDFSTQESKIEVHERQIEDTEFGGEKPRQIEDFGAGQEHDKLPLRTT